MNPAKEAELKFLEWAKTHGFKYKVAGDNAYSSKPMGQGRYAKMKSAKNGKIWIVADGIPILLES